MCDSVRLDRRGAVAELLGKWCRVMTPHGRKRMFVPAKAYTRTQIPLDAQVWLIACEIDYAPIAEGLCAVVINGAAVGVARLM